MPESPHPAKSPLLSSDSWAVLLSIALAILVRFGVLSVVPW
jgi:hypothetical protein